MSTEPPIHQRQCCSSRDGLLLGRIPLRGGAMEMTSVLVGRRPRHALTIHPEKRPGAHAGGPSNRPLEKGTLKRPPFESARARERRA